MSFIVIVMSELEAKLAPPIQGVRITVSLFSSILSSEGEIVSVAEVSPAGIMIFVPDIFLVTRLFPRSATYKFPDGSNAKSVG